MITADKSIEELLEAVHNELPEHVSGLSPEDVGTIVGTFLEKLVGNGPEAGADEALLFLARACKNEPGATLQ